MKFQIDLNTGNRFWTPKGLGALGMDPNRAIAELVANSLDWRREPVSGFEPIIQVIISHNSIEIKDNGVGMDHSELQNAIQVSVANDGLRPNLRVRKGMFGMGMKVACLSLGWKITVHTRSLSEENIENTLTLDTRKLDTDGVSSDYRASINGESTEFIADGTLNGWRSGTSILIEDLTHKSLTAIAVRDSLQEVFSPEISVENINIEVVDKHSNVEYKCQKVEIPIYPETKINLDELDLYIEDEQTGVQQKITGWLGLMKTGASGSGRWGLHLFKNNQVIERFHQLPSRLGGLMPKNPHPKYGRTYGEVHLDMCVPAFHKVGFDYSTPSWMKAGKLLENHILTIMQASENFRVSDYEKSREAIRKVQKHKRAIKKTLANSKRNTVEFTPDAPENAIILPSGLWFTIVEPIIDKFGNSEKNKPWIYHYREESRELAIIINEESPIYVNLISGSSNEETITLLICWAISDCILVLLCEQFGFELLEAVLFRDEQLIWLTSERGGEDA